MIPMTKREAWLAIALSEGIGPKTFTKLVSACDRLGLPPAELLSRGEGELAAQLDLSAAQMESLAELEQTARAVEALAGDFDEQNITYSLRWEEDYPSKLLERMGGSAPPVVFMKGSPEALTCPLAAIIGSRTPTEEGIERASACARTLADEGYGVVTGFALGVDLAANVAALESGTPTVAVLGAGILRIPSRRRVLDEFALERILFLSEFPPLQTWNTGATMARNRTVVALSDLAIVVEAKRRGGSVEAGRAALQLNVPLFAYSDSPEPILAEGTRLLIDLGATPVAQSCDILDQLDALTEEEPSSNGKGQQMEMPLDA